MQNFNNHNNWYTPPNFHGFMPQVQSLQPSYLRSPEPAQQETKISEETKAKQERWTARQAEVSVSLWVENFEALESSRGNQVWAKVGKQSMPSWSNKNTETVQGENTKFEGCLQEM